MTMVHRFSDDVRQHLLVALDTVSLVDCRERFEFFTPFFGGMP
jgi:hypothetical protein